MATTNETATDNASFMRKAKSNMYSGQQRWNVTEEEDTPPNPDAGPGESPNPDADGRDANLTPEEKTWRERYSNLRRLQQKKDEDTAKSLKDLQTQLDAFKNKGQTLPVSEEEIKDWMSKYPDLAAAILHLSDKTADEKLRDITAKMAKLEENSEAVAREKAYLELKKVHKDIDDINASEDFQVWVDNQPQNIQDWFFKNETDHQLAARGISLFKAETGWGSKKKALKTEEARDNSRGVTTPRAAEINAEGGGKKQWRESEIRKLTPKEFEKNEEDIELAMREGRIIHDLQNSKL